jgi:hypothetical protein
MAGNIEIDETTLKAFQGEYNGYTDDIKKAATTNYTWGNSSINMSAQFTLPLGGSNFKAASGLKDAIEGVRQNLFGRMQASYTDTYDIYAGVTSLLADTDAVENLNTMTGQEFDSYIPTSPPQLGSKSPSGTPQAGS